VSPLRVVLADDNVYMRSGLRSLLESTGEVVVVGSAANGREAVDLTAEHRPDIVLLDIKMPVLDGVAATREIRERWPDQPILVLTHSDEPAIIEQVLRAGADSYLVHDSFTTEDLMRAAAGTAAGETHLSHQPAAVAVALLRNGPAATETAAPTADLGLTKGEAETLDLMARGLSNQEIAGALHLSVSTVKNRINRLFAKLGVATRAEAIAIRLGTRDRGPGALEKGP
jgi:DNA-binding NarL/FixJ family response regulator